MPGARGAAAQAAAVPVLLSRDEVAERLGVSAATLRDWAASGLGPPCIRVGRRAMYRSDDFATWINAQRPYGGEGARR